MSLSEPIDMRDLTEGVYSVRPVDPVTVEVDANGNVRKVRWTNNMLQIITPDE